MEPQAPVRPFLYGAWAASDRELRGDRQSQPGLGQSAIEESESVAGVPAARSVPSRVSQPCHALAEPGGYRRSQEDTKKDPTRVQEEPRGPYRTREDTASRRFGTVRPRGQIPGPRPFSYSKSTISNVVWSQLHTAVSQFPAEQRNRGGVTASVAGNVRSRDWESLGRQRPKPADARGRTVRHQVRESSAPFRSVPVHLRSDCGRLTSQHHEQARPQLPRPDRWGARR
jgi:hypothetical protein